MNDLANKHVFLCPSELKKLVKFFCEISERFKYGRERMQTDPAAVTAAPKVKLSEDVWLGVVVVRKYISNSEYS